MDEEFLGGFVIPNRAPPFREVKRQHRSRATLGGTEDGRHLESAITLLDIDKDWLARDQRPVALTLKCGPVYVCVSESRNADEPEDPVFIEELDGCRPRSRLSHLLAPAQEAIGSGHQLRPARGPVERRLWIDWDEMRGG